MVDYWAYTKDTTWEQDTLNAMNAQVGPNYDFVMPQQAFDTGNDDQAFWVFPALSALEYGMPLLPCPAGTSNSGNQICPTHYLNLAVNAFNDYVYRWGLDSNSCGGGLKWQFSPNLAGFDYKNSVSNGAFFQVAARLARYTGNQTYADWAIRVYDWSTTIGLVDADFSVFDGTDDTKNCSKIDHTSWTYNSGMYMYGCAVMYDYTKGSALWKSRVSGFVNKASVSFFHLYPNATGIMYEAPCEPISSCTTDQFSFKAYLARWMAKTSVLAPFVQDQVMGLLTSTANAVGRSCIPSATGVACGTAWWKPAYDGNTGVGQQLSALEVIQALLIGNGPAPATSNGKVFVLVAPAVQTSAAASSAPAPARPTTTALVVPASTQPAIGGGAVVSPQSSSANAAPAPASSREFRSAAAPPSPISSSTAVVAAYSAVAPPLPPPVMVPFSTVFAPAPPTSVVVPPAVVLTSSVDATSVLATSAIAPPAVVVSSFVPPPPVVVTSSVVATSEVAPSASPLPIIAPPINKYSDIASSVVATSIIAPPPILVASSAAAISSIVHTAVVAAGSSASPAPAGHSTSAAVSAVVVTSSIVATSVVASSDGASSLAQTSSAQAASASGAAIATTVLTTTTSNPQAIPAAAATTTKKSAAISMRYVSTNTLALMAAFVPLLLAI